MPSGDDPAADGDLSAGEPRAGSGAQSEAGPGAVSDADHGAWKPPTPPLPRTPVHVGDARFEAMVAYGADVLSVHDAKGRFIYVSPAVTHNLGYEPEELLGTSSLDLIHPDDRAQMLQIFVAQVLEGVPPAPVEYRVRHKDGSWRWLEGWCTDLTDNPNVGGLLVNARNVTDRHEAEAALRSAEARQRAILENVSELIVVIDAEGRIRGNPTGTMVLGSPEGFASGEDMLSYVHPADRERVRDDLLSNLDKPGFTDPVEVRLRHIDGSWRHCEAIGNNMVDNPTVAGAVVTIRDITERKHAEMLLARESRILERVAPGEPLENVFDTIVNMIEEQTDDAHVALVMFGKPGEPPAFVAAPHLDANWEVTADMATALAEPGWVSLDSACPRCPGFGLSHPITEQAGAPPRGAVVLFPSERRFPTDRERRAIEVGASLGAITLERIETVEELAFRASHDPLTGLPTRATFSDDLAGALESRRSGDREIAVVFLDLDRFKDVNDGLGHDAGDRILCVLAERLNSSVRSDDLVARFGGDEFAVMAHVEGPAHARVIADRLLDAISTPIDLGGSTCQVSASAGIAVPADDPADADALVRDADAAMYRAKQNGRARAELFDDTLRSGLMARVDMETGLRQALELDEFVIEYQPMISVPTGRVEAVEALVRWQHPDGRVIPPDEFIPLAEDSGLIVPIGRLVLEQAALQAARWSALRPDHPATVLAVNLSARQLAHPELVTDVAAAIETAGAEPARVALEITESVLLEDLDGTLRTLDALRELGVLLVIDDFGTGYSSLSYLKRLPVSMLKIDRVFVAGLAGSPQDRAIVRAVIELAHALDLQVVAEGVEDPEQLRALERFGCDFAQGFLLAVPQPAEQIDRLLAADLRPGLYEVG